MAWEFVVVTDFGALRSIATAAGCEGLFADAPVCVVVLCRNTKC